jgi:hypothetical protein
MGVELRCVHGSWSLWALFILLALVDIGRIMVKVKGWARKKKDLHVS